MKTALDKTSQLTNKCLEESCDDESESKTKVSDDSDSYCSGENDNKIINSVSPNTPNTPGRIVFENINSNSTVTDCFIDSQIQSDAISMVNGFDDCKINFKQASKQYSFYSSWESVVQKDYLVVFNVYAE